MIPIALYFVRYKTNSKIKGLSFFVVYLIYCFFNEVLNYYLYIIRHNETYLFINLFSVIEFLFIYLFYIKILQRNFHKKLLSFISAAFIVYCFIDLFIIEDFTSTFASGPAAIEAIILLTFSILFLFEQVNDTFTIFIYSKKSFWIVVAIIIYLSGTFFLFIFAQKNMNDPEFANQYLVMNSILYIIKNLIISIAFLIEISDDSEIANRSYIKNSF